MESCLLKRFGQSFQRLVMIKDKMHLLYSKFYNLFSFSSTVYLGMHRKLQKSSWSGIIFWELSVNFVYFLKFMLLQKWWTNRYILMRVKYSLSYNNKGNGNSTIFKLWFENSFVTLAWLDSINIKRDRETGRESVPSLVFLEEHL